MAVGTRNRRLTWGSGSERSRALAKALRRGGAGGQELGQFFGGGRRGRWGSRGAGPGPRPGPRPGAGEGGLALP